VRKSLDSYQGMPSGVPKVAENGSALAAGIRCSSCEQHFSAAPEGGFILCVFGALETVPWYEPRLRLLNCPIL